jgi:hypothetical protein
MVKKVAFLVVGTLIVNASSLDTNCLNCHKQNKLPTKLMYKRYLMKYSTQKNIKDAIYKYLKNPNPKNSIMPQQFFLKFNTKNIPKIDDKALLKNIDLFIQKYDLKKRLK